ncbi:MAG: hypothetical protein WHX52_21675 [Anaerolineae bacterium]
MDIAQWHAHVLRPLLDGQPLTANVEELGGLALLAADTDRTQDYVFESARLPEVRGASWLLDDLNVNRIPALFRQQGLAGTCVDADPPGEIVYVGGGGLLALVPERIASSLAQAIEAEYPAVTGAATITADWRPVTPEMIRDGYPDNGFGGLVRWAGGWLRRRKESKSPPPFYEALSHAARCRSCYHRPAHKVLFPDDPGGGWPICHVCERKRLDRSLWFDRYHQRYGVIADRPQDLSEIGQASRGRKRYVGFIHLDGDGLGDCLLAFWQPLEYKAFSAGIATAMENAVMEALRRLLPPADVTASEARRDVGQAHLVGSPVRLHPFEIITIGGDDVWLIVPGDAALPVAAAIVQGFQAAGLRRPDNGKLCTLSGGVVIADDHNPVRVLRDVAKDLAREAKRARQDAGAEIGYIDFHIFKSADMLDRNLSRLREHYPYTLPYGAKDLYLLARPYPADILAVLWERLRALRTHGFPPSQMHLLAESLLRGRRESSLFYLYQQARDTDGHLERLGAALDVVQSSHKCDPIPWQKLQDERYSHRTALWDIAELYDFVSAAKE